MTRLTSRIFRNWRCATCQRWNHPVQCILWALKQAGRQLSFSGRNTAYAGCRADWGALLQGSADEVTGAMAKVFVWLRYSASRQLTWQRNYNTQPRILGEAQARLTNAIAQVRCRRDSAPAAPDIGPKHLQPHALAWMHAAGLRHSLCCAS